nr:Chain A, Cannabinoid receptor 1 [synthetic construct]
DIRLAKTLV